MAWGFPVVSCDVLQCLSLSKKNNNTFRSRQKPLVLPFTVFFWRKYCPVLINRRGLQNAVVSCLKLRQKLPPPSLQRMLIGPIRFRPAENNSDWRYSKWICDNSGLKSIVVILTVGSVSAAGWTTHMFQNFSYSVREPQRQKHESKLDTVDRQEWRFHV